MKMYVQTPIWGEKNEVKDQQAQEIMGYNQWEGPETLWRPKAGRN